MSAKLRLEYLKVWAQLSAIRLGDMLTTTRLCSPFQYRRSIPSPVAKLQIR